MNLVDEVMVAPRYAFPRLPGLQVIERPGMLQLITPLGTMNEVVYSELGDDADAVIDATIASYRALGVRFRWNVGPHSTPADLADRLERRGLVPHWVCGVAREIGNDNAPADVAVVDARTLDAFTHVMALGWSAEVAALRELHAFVLAEGRQHMFLAYADGEPAAAATYLAFERSAFLMGAVVLPQFRGRGLYRALVTARLAHARLRGIALATSHANEATSAPVLAHMGFATICRFRSYSG